MIALTGKKYVEKLVQMSDALNCHFSFRMNNEIMAIPEELEKREGFLTIGAVWCWFSKVQQVRDLLVLINGLFKDIAPVHFSFLKKFYCQHVRKWINNSGVICDLPSALYKPKFLSFYLLAGTDI